MKDHYSESEIDPADLDRLSETQLRIMEAEKDYTRDTYDVKRVVKMMQGGGIAKSGDQIQKVITLRSTLNIDQSHYGAQIVAYEWIQTKGLRYSGY